MTETSENFGLVEKPPEPIRVDYNSFSVGFVSLTVGHWDLMYDHMRSIYDCYPHPKEFFIIPNLNQEVSLAAAINKGFKRAMKECDYIVYCADDVIVKGNDIQNMLNELIVNKLWVVLSSHGFSFFCVDPVIFRIVGFWDEDFYPAYFEDNDWYYRIKLVDLSKIGAVETESEHITSVTIKRMSPQKLAQHHVQFNANRERYIAKWGGEPGHEAFLTPYGA